MNMLASGFANFINGIFANWQMLLFAVAAVLLLLVILFRKFRLLTVILSVVAAGICGALIVNLAVKAMSWGMPEFVAFLVKWVPTLLFTLTVLFTTLVGVLRGLRKSLILLTHEVCIAALCIILYVILIKMPEVDVFMLKIVDMLFGGKGAFAAALGVKAQCKGLKDVFVEWLPTVLNGDFAILLGESKAYIYTLTDLIYHVAFALVLYVLFMVLDFIMYLIYLFCYSELKYKRRIKKEYAENKVDRRYTKHRLGGGVVGLVRGVTIGLLSLSFMGTALYIAVGRGDGKVKDFDFGDENINEVYSVYRSLESYGTYGIFRVLNSISSAEEVPYYLFAADLVFSGELDDSEFGVSDNVVFREELAAYTGFARDTMGLLLKYGGDEIKPLIKGEATDGAFDTVLKVMSDEGFRVEFNDLVSEFDAKTYIINFAMSFVNSAIANLDDMSFASSINEQNRELLKILFTKGYLSDAIPDEKAMKQAFTGTPVSVVQPYVNISRLINKKDVQIIFNLVLDVMGQKTSSTNDVLKMVAEVLPQIRQLSLLNENRAEELDPVLGRLYCYAANCYLTEEGAEGVNYSYIYDENIEWVSEINALLDVTEATFNLYENISPVSKPLDAVISVFDEENPDYRQNIRYFDDITNSVLNSRILGKTLETSKIYTLIEKALSGLFDGIYIPKDIVYETVYDDNGELVQAGEMYNVLYGLSAIGKESDLLPMLSSFDKDKDMEEFLNALSSAVVFQDKNGNTIADYVVRSKLLRSVISAAFINYGEAYAYVPTVAREKDADGNTVKLIKEEELYVLFGNLPELVDFIKPVLGDEEADMTDKIGEFVDKPVFKSLLGDSSIFAGTMALHLVNKLKDDSTVVIPQSLKDNLDGWVTSGGKQGEIKNLLDALDAANIKIADIVSGKFDDDSIIDNFTSETFTDESLQTCLKSGVLHYTVSKFLIDGGSDFGSFRLIVPQAAQQTLTDDSIPALVRKGEVENVLKFVKALDLSEKPDVSAVLSKLVQPDNKKMLAESYILSASVVGSLVDNSDVNDMLRLSEKYSAAATDEKLNKFNASNPWKTEIVRLITSLDEIMGISVTEDKFEFSEDKLQDSLSSFLKNMNEPSVAVQDAHVSRLTVSYASEVVRGAISARLDEMFESNIDAGILYGAKSGGYYTENELRSLCNVLNVFDIDLMKQDADELVNKIKSEVLTLNGDAPEGYTGTKLSVVYPSAIFSGILSKSLDDVLLNGKDEDGKSAPLIEEDVLYKIKAGSSRYKQSVVADLINSIKALGLKDYNELSNLDMDTVLDNIENTDEVCGSVIVRGVFTKQINESETLDVDHPLAYEEDIKVLKAGEITAVVKVIGKIDGVDEDFFSKVSISEVRENIFDEDGSVKSYLLLKGVSDSLTDSDYLIIDGALVDKYDCIESGEVAALFNAFAVMFGEDASINKINDNEGFKYPDSEDRKTISESSIVRAKLTEQFRTNEQNTTEFFVKAANLSKFTEYNSTKKYCSLNADEIIALFNALDIINEGNETFDIPSSMSLNDLKRYYELGQQNDKDYIRTLFDSDVIRYKICETILETPLGNNLESTEETAIGIKSQTEQVKSVLSYEQVLDFVKKIN